MEISGSTTLLRVKEVMKNEREQKKDSKACRQSSASSLQRHRPCQKHGPVQ